MEGPEELGEHQEMQDDPDKSAPGMAATLGHRLGTHEAVGEGGRLGHSTFKVAQVC